MSKSGIHIKPSKKGTFTAAAKKHGKGVQEFARQVMANKENYSPAMVKKANFARNAAKWKHESGGGVDAGYQELGGVHSMRPLPGHQVPVGKAFTPTPGHQYPFYERDMQPLPQKAMYGADIEPFVYNGYSDNTPIGDGIRSNYQAPKKKLSAKAGANMNKFTAANARKWKHQDGGEVSQDQKVASFIGGMFSMPGKRMEEAQEILKQAAPLLLREGGCIPMAQGGLSAPPELQMLPLPKMQRIYNEPGIDEAPVQVQQPAPYLTPGEMAKQKGLAPNPMDYRDDTQNQLQQTYDTNKAARKKFDKGLDKINKPKSNIDYQQLGGNMFSAGLGLASLIASKKQPTRHYYYTPEDTPYYNPYPMGTGSQAIYNQGGFVNSNAVDFPYKSGIRFKEGGEIMNVASPEFPIARMGGQMRRNYDMSEYEQGGELELYDDRTGAQPISENPASGPIVEFKGPSHEERNGVGSKGIPMAWQGNEVEVEGGETAFEDNQGNFQILGNMKNPLTGRKFKQDGKLIAKAERKADNKMQKGLDLVNEADPDNPYEMLKFNTGKAKMQGAMQKFKEMDELRHTLADIQQQKLDLAASLGIEPMEMDKKAYLGKMMTAQGGRGLTKKFGDFTPVNTDSVPLMPPVYVTAKGRKKVAAPPAPTSGPLRPFKQWESTADVVPMEPVTVTATKKKKIAPPPLPESGLFGVNQWSPSSQNTPGIAPNYVPPPGGSAIGISQWTPPPSNPFNNADVLDTAYVTAKVPSKTSSASVAAKNTSTRTGGDRPPTRGGNERPLRPSMPKPVDIPYSMGSVTADIPYTPTQLTPPSGETPPDIVNPPVTGQTFGFDVPPTVDLTSDAEGFNWMNAYPEIYAMATNQVEPVLMQKYRPELLQPYQVTFQDQLNRNTDTFRAMAQASGWNPSAMGALAAQRYAADQGVLGNEFRTNQELSANVANANRQIMNETQKMNLGLADQQYVRQAQARANTRQRAFDALQSLSTKQLQHQKAMNELKTMENLYNYRFNKDYQAKYEGPKAIFNDPLVAGVDKDGNPIYKTDLLPASATKAKTKTKGKYGINIAREFKNYK